MEGLIRFLKRFYFLILFLILETIALFMAIGSDVQRSSVFLNSANVVSGFLYDWMQNYVQYFHLKDENKNLIKEYIELKNSSEAAFFMDTTKFYAKGDTISSRKFLYKHALVLKNSIHKSNNFITLNKGENQGVRPDMGVVAANGIVGIITSSSKNYSIALTVLNSAIGLSAKLKRNQYFGSLIWDGKDYRYAVLKEIPNHLELNIGDTIVTSGYSAIFPKGVLIGSIADFKKNSKDNFYTIKVKLSVDFKKLNNVIIIENLHQKEQLQLEEQTF